MKKILLSAAVGSLFFTANADQTVVTAHEEPAIVVEQAPEVCECPFGGLYLGLGIGGSFLKHDADLKANRFIGTVALGGGKVFKEKYYLGLEGMMDFTKQKKKEFTEDGHKIQAKTSGCIPSIGIRLGYVYNTWLVYGKISASHASFEVNDFTENENFSVKKFAPALALGVEKAFCKKFTARLEGDWRFASKKEGTSTNKGFTVRALVAYNVKI